MDLSTKAYFHRTILVKRFFARAYFILFYFMGYNIQKNTLKIPKHISTFPKTIYYYSF